MISAELIVLPMTPIHRKCYGASHTLDSAPRDLSGYLPMLRVVGEDN